MMGDFRRPLALAILIAGVAIPAWVAGLLAKPPHARNIHIEAYRYGFSPARISANRGDRLRFTFSTRDTGQSFFLQDYDLHVSITPGNRMVSVQRLSRPDDPPEIISTNTKRNILADEIRILISLSFSHQWPGCPNFGQHSLIEFTLSYDKVQVPNGVECASPIKSVD